MTMISNVMVVDPDTEDVSKPVDILVTDGIVQRISPHTLQTEKTPLFAFPALIECHSHLFEKPTGALKGSLIEFPDEKAAFDMADEAIQLLLTSGVTTVRDMGAQQRLNNRYRDYVTNENRSQTIRIVSCGSHITRFGGHFSDRGRILGEPPEDVSTAVIDEMKLGADFIKVMNDHVIFQQSELKKMAETAQSMSTYLACHAYTPKAVEIAISSGSRTVEHSAGFKAAEWQKSKNSELYFCPTYCAAVDTLECMDEVLSVFPDCDESTFVTWIGWLEEYIPLAFKFGARIISGTDSGILPTNFDSLPRELSHYVRLGATNAQALRTATSEAARALMIDHHVGHISPGKEADIIISPINPLVDLQTSLNKKEAVFHRGNVVAGKGP